MIRSSCLSRMDMWTLVDPSISLLWRLLFFSTLMTLIPSAWIAPLNPLSSFVSHRKLADFLMTIMSSSLSQHTVAVTTSLAWCKNPYSKQSSRAFPLESPWISIPSCSNRLCQHLQQDWGKNPPQVKNSILDLIYQSLCPTFQINPHAMISSVKQMYDNNEGSPITLSVHQY